MAPNWIIRFLALAFGACATAFAQPVDHPYGRSQPIPGRYIVVFKAHVADPAAETASLARGLGAQLHFTYTSAIKGFAATLPDAAVQALRNNPNVDYVEQDQTISLNQEPDVVTQGDADWGLDRIDQTSVPEGSDALQSPYDYRYKYTASGVNAFIIDTGIRANHNDFGGRVRASDGFTAIADGRNTDDCNGHGTHVAGTVGGMRWGVAKQVTLIPVRVLNCQGSGTWSGVIAGIDFSANSPLRPAVANMSLGGGASSAVDQAVAGAVSKGITMVVAAGNSNADACNYSPARAPSAITVGATTIGDARASYSNYGSCLDLFAPGSNITSAWNTNNDATKTISGTSMASPHVAGVAALALHATPTASPWAVTEFLKSKATSSWSTAYQPMVYSLWSGVPQASDTQFVAAKSYGTPNVVVTANGGWRVSVAVTVGARKDNSWSTEKVRYATVTGYFDPGGTVSCVTDDGATESCVLTSATIKRNVSSTRFTLRSISGWYLDDDLTSYANQGNSFLIEKK